MDRPPGIGNYKGEQNKSVNSGNDAIESQKKKKKGSGYKDGHFFPYNLRMHNEGRNKRRHTQYDKNIENIASDNISHGNSHLADQGRLETYRGFGRTGSKGYHRQTDHKGRNSYQKGKPSGSFHQKIRTIG
jgi:hypothetical protein